MALVSPGNLTVSGRSALELPHHALEPLHHARKPFVIELVGSIVQRVIVRIAVRRGVGHHHRGPAEFPVGPLVGPAYARDRLQSHGALRRKRRVTPERADDPAHEIPRARVGDETDEIARRRIEQVEGKRVALASGRVAVPTDRLKGEHRDDFPSLALQAARVYVTAHSFRAEPGRDTSRLRTLTPSASNSWRATA